MEPVRAAEIRGDCGEVGDPVPTTFEKRAGSRAWGPNVILLLLGAFFAVFLFYPLLYVFRSAFWSGGRFTLEYFRIMFVDEAIRACVRNSFLIAASTTLLTTLVAVPLGQAMLRYRFAGKGFLQAALLVPLIMPPFVGAIGLHRLFGLHGAVNILLVDVLHWMREPVDWFGSRVWGVIFLETLHLYPIMYLNVTAALANIDPAMEEAALNLGARRGRLFRTITFPLMLPGYFAGAVLVFVWAFTDLGTPLMFQYRSVVPVQIFDRVKDINENPMGYALVVLTVALTAACFLASRAVAGRKRFEMIGRGHTSGRETDAGPVRTVVLCALTGGLVVLALLPHLGVVLTSFAREGSWFMTVAPGEWTLDHYRSVFGRKDVFRSIQNSLTYSTASTAIDLVLGVTIAYLVTRRRVRGSAAIDAVAMMPLALPGVVLAFGYVGCFSGTALDPRESPVLLLVVSYAVRRLPYVVRSAIAGFQQTSVTLEEASLNLGATSWATMRRITFPLIAANLVAGGILAFAFAMLEVSDSLILAMKSQFYPITKAIFVLYQRLGDGEYVASALGVLGMALLAGSLFLASRILGRRMGQLFRA